MICSPSTMATARTLPITVVITALPQQEPGKKEERNTQAGQGFDHPAPATVSPGDIHRVGKGLGFLRQQDGAAAPRLIPHRDSRSACNPPCPPTPSVRSIPELAHQSVITIPACLPASNPRHITPVQLSSRRTAASINRFYRQL